MAENWTPLLRNKALEVGERLAFDRDFLTQSDLSEAIAKLAALSAELAAGEPTKFRMVRMTTQPLTEQRAYRVETVAPMTEPEAMALMRHLGSPYIGHKYLPPKEGAL